MPASTAAEGNGGVDGVAGRDAERRSEQTVLKRIIGAESTQVASDGAGRICVPEEMARAASIQSEAVLVGLLDRFEIWDPARYERVKAADAVLAQEAFKLME